MSVRPSVRPSETKFIRNSFADGEPVQLLQCARNMVARSELQDESRCSFLDTLERFDCFSREAGEYGVAVVDTRHDYCKHKSH